MDNTRATRLREAAQRLGLDVSEEVAMGLWNYAAELLRWNQKVNLTAITAEDEVLEKHLLDSITALPEVSGAQTLLDLGAGGGLPGIPLAIALPALKVTLVDAVSKKIAFLKHLAARPPLTGRVRALHQRVAGSPSEEGVPLAEVVICRAFMELSAFLPLGKSYLAPQGRIVAMLGRAPAESEIRELAARHGLQLTKLREFALPMSGAPRAIASFGPP